MAVITELSAEIITQALEQYDLGVLRRFKPADDGIENTNYFVTTTLPNGSVGEYVLTLIESDEVERRRSMFAILKASAAHGLSVPVVMQTASGNPEGSVDGKPIVICQRLQGSHIVHPARRQCSEIGRFLARLHLANVKIEEDVCPYVRDADWLLEKTELVKGEIGWMDRHLLEHTLDHVMAVLSRNDLSQIPIGVVHADLFRDNALFNQYGLSGVVDFHHSGVGYWLYDISVAVNDWCRNGDRLDTERTLALLNAYHAIRPLTRFETWIFPDMLLYGGLAFWLSRLLIAVRTDLPPNYPVKDPAEFGLLVRTYHRSPFRLDLDLLTA